MLLAVAKCKIPKAAIIRAYTTAAILEGIICFITTVLDTVKYTSIGPFASELS
jgi:hypothetical protein